MHVREKFTLHPCCLVTELSMSAQGDSPGDRGEDLNKQRQSNLQRIQQRKQSVREWPKDKKLEKLAIYSSCKEDESCKCNGWKNPNPPPNPWFWVLEKCKGRGKP